MKTIFKIAVCLLILFIFQSGCRGKRMQRQMMRESDKIEQTRRTQHFQSEGWSLSNLHSEIDSSKLVYQVKIFPLDSFSYSMQDGFKGAASRIEIAGSLQNHKWFEKYTTASAKKLSDSSSIVVRKEKNLVKATAKVVKRKESLFIFLGVLVLLISVWIWWRKTRRHRPLSSGQNERYTVE